MSRTNSKIVIYLAVVLFLVGGIIIGFRLSSTPFGSQSVTTVEVTETLTRVVTTKRNATVTVSG